VSRVGSSTFHTPESERREQCETRPGGSGHQETFPSGELSNTTFFFKILGACVIILPTVVAVCPGQKCSNQKLEPAVRIHFFQST
jgi:hypothetical protein